MTNIMENGIPAGNWDNKYETANPAGRFFSYLFLREVKKILAPVSSEIGSIVELGCGQGHLTSYINSLGITNDIKGCDVSGKIIEIASERNAGSGIEFYTKSIYDTDYNESADLIVCCEVLEHLEYPEKALEIIASIRSRYVLLSVPREPLWRIVHILAMKNLSSLGNTPGHIQHYSAGSFIETIEPYFNIIKVRKPARLWTIALCEPRFNAC